MIRTADGLRLRLGRQRAVALAARLESLGLAEAVRANYRGDLPRAVARTVAHLGRSARRTGTALGPRTRRRYTVLTAGDEGQQFRLLALPLPDGTLSLLEVRGLGPAGDREDSDATRAAQMDVLRVILGFPPVLTPPMRAEMLRLAALATRAGKAQVLPDGRTNRANRPDRYYVSADGKKRINVEVDTVAASSRRHMQRLRAADPTTHNYFLHIDPVTGQVKRALYTPPNRRKPRVIYQPAQPGPVEAVGLPLARQAPLVIPKTRRAAPVRKRRPSRELEGELDQAAAALEQELAAAIAGTGPAGQRPN